MGDFKPSVSLQPSPFNLVILQWSTGPRISIYYELTSERRPLRPKAAGAVRRFSTKICFLYAFKWLDRLYLYLKADLRHRLS